MGHLNVVSLLLIPVAVLAGPFPQLPQPSPYQPPSLLPTYLNSSIPGITQTYIGTAAPIYPTGSYSYPQPDPPAITSYANVTSTVTTSGTTYVVIPTTVFSTQTVTLTHTFSFTQGYGTMASIRTIYVTKTVTEILPCPTTVIVTSSTSTPLSSDRSTSLSTTSKSPRSTSTSTTTTSSVPTSTSSSTSASCATVAAPAPTQADAVKDCTLWHVAISGEYCYLVAEDYGISVDTFMAWNPDVEAPTCPNMLAGYAYCVARCGDDAPVTTADVSTGLSSSTLSIPTTTISTSSYSATSTLTSSATSSADPPSQTGSGSTNYVVYTGDGTVAQGWPSQDQWVEFDYMFEVNTPAMSAACAAWGVPDNTEEESATVKDAIQSLAATTGVDERLILAVVMQESTGCVRVITTAYSVFNPGLMQSHNGTGTCNTNNAPFGIPGITNEGIVQDPCPAAEIHQMIQDGTAGTSSGDGLQQLLAAQTATDVSRFYRTARMYNGGSNSIGSDGNLESGCCTACYVSDIANRLTGWTTSPRTCNL